MTATLRDRLAERLASVEDRINRACARARRNRAEVTLVAVTKTVSIEAASLLPELGVPRLGENRPQELWRKSPALPGVLWQLIGNLQRNKIERTLPLVERIHSVDSVRLLQALEQEAERTNRGVRALLEVNASGETSKHGFAPSEVLELAEQLRALRRVRVEGLMTMAAYADDPEACRPTFRLVQQLRDQMQAKLGETHRLADLSMGMSNDFEVAIEEGATLIRLGTVIFEGLGDAE